MIKQIQIQAFHIIIKVQKGSSLPKKDEAYEMAQE